jgi:hypothetical protein
VNPDDSTPWPGEEHPDTQPPDATAGGDGVVEQQVAALQATVEIQQLSLNRLSAEVRRLTDLLSTPPAADEPEATPKQAAGEAQDKPAPWCWRDLPPHQAAALWRELADWLAWLHTRYPLAETIPGCWWRHPELVEELTAAHAAWKAAYTSPGASPYGPGEWHDRWLPGLEQRLTTRWKTGRCTDHHQDRSPTAYGTPIDNSDAFSAHVQAAGHAPPEAMSLDEAAEALAAGDAELLGRDLGDPLYCAGRYWQLSPEADSYREVTDPQALQALGETRRQTRLGHSHQPAH